MHVCVWWGHSPPPFKRQYGIVVTVLDWEHGEGVLDSNPHSAVMLTRWPWGSHGLLASPTSKGSCEDTMWGKRYHLSYSEVVERRIPEK